MRIGAWTWTLGPLASDIAMAATISPPERASNQSMHQWTKRDWNVEMCSGEQQKVITAATIMVMNMLRASTIHLSLFKHTLQTNHDKQWPPDFTKGSDSSEFMHNDNEQVPTYLRTFSKLYGVGKNWQEGMSVTQSSNLVRAVQEKKRLAKKLRKGIEESPSLPIICGDEWLLDRYPNGDPPKQGPGYKIDSRWTQLQQDSDPYIQKEIWWPWRMSDPPGEDNPPAPESVHLQSFHGAEPDKIVLNPRMFDKWNRSIFVFKYKLPTVEEDIVEDEISIEDIAQGRLEVVLLHHLSQMNEIISDNGSGLISVWNLDLPPLNIGPFGWSNAIRMAEISRIDASANADNFVFLILALFLDKWDWANGRNLNIPKLLWYGDNPIWPPPYPPHRPQRPNPEPGSPTP